MYGLRIITYDYEACGREFNTERAMEQHMDAKGHHLIECHVCYDKFYDEENRRQHEYIEHNYCADCSRTFRHYNNLRMCSKNFTTATGLAHHFEMNACPNATTSRESVHHYVLSKDPNGLVANKMIEWNGPVTYEATSRTWNGAGYECYLCHRDFNSLHGLNQHLNSAAHQQALYHCPNRDCQDFKTLAAIINHLESETCGIARFDAVQRGVGQMIGAGRLISF